MADLADLDAFRAALRKNLEESNAYLEAMLGEKVLDFDKTFAEVEAAAARLAPLVCDTSAWLHNAIRGGKRVLFEGAQGVMLDVDHGTYPFVTSSNTGSGSIATGAGIGPKQVGNVVGITKAYSTRVGSGPFPTELDNAVSEHLRKEGGEFGATTGRPRRCGWFDAMVVRKSVRLCGVDALALTKLDVLSGLDSLSICTGYELDGRAIENLPPRSEDLDRVEPVYEEVEGWTDDLTGIRSRAELPPAAERYVARLEELVETHVGILSTGPGREQTVIIDPPFGGDA
ncbi:MAG: adenylosuccinate synthase [Hyphomicrobiaceae bacterium]|jgi:adenylosuccinate synthase